MPNYIIERDLFCAGKITGAELHSVSQKSREVRFSLGREIQSLRSRVTADKLCCEYIAPSEELIYEHARLGGFPAIRVSSLEKNIDSATAE